MKWSQSFGFESVAGGRSAHGFVHRTGQCRRHGCGGNVEWRSHVQNCLQSSAVPMHPGGKAVRGVGKRPSLPQAWRWEGFGAHHRGSWNDLDTHGHDRHDDDDDDLIGGNRGWLWRERWRW